MFKSLGFMFNYSMDEVVSFLVFMPFWVFGD